MKKFLMRTLSTLLVVVMLLSSAPLSGFMGLELPSLSELFSSKVSAEIYSGTCGDNLTWNLDTETGVLTIRGTGEMTNYSSYSSVPWYSYRSYIKTVILTDGIKSIGNNAFYDCTSLTNVSLGSGVTSIGSYAFRSCSSLTRITIPETVRSIGSYAFYSCNSLTSITIPDGVTKIDNYVFAFCNSLTGITIPDSVTSIGNFAFEYCYSLTSIIIPDSVTSISDYAFAYSFFTSITIPDSVTSVNNYVFYNCTSLTNVTLGSGVTSIGIYAFGNCNNLTSITIPDSVTSIGDAAFSSCFSLASITIPNRVTSIGDAAFSGCRLASITIPDSVTSIGNDAFRECTSAVSLTLGSGVTSMGSCAFYECLSLERITVDENNQYYSSDLYGVLFNKDKTKLIQYPAGNKRAEYIVHDSVTSIGSYAFYKCSNLTSITIPDSVTNLDNYAFAYSYFTSITIPISVTRISDYAFNACVFLESITIPDNVTSIGNGAFAYCGSLKYIHIPKDTISIGDSILYFYASAYICSDTEDCYAKTYADENDIEFRVCNGHGSDTHEHDYATFSHYQTEHPHYAVCKCSCAAEKATSQTTTVDSCEICNPPHICDYATLSHYQTEHPHYAVYKCECGAEKVTTETTTVDSCEICNPPHICDYATFSHYQTEHPHYAVYKCECGAEKATTETTTIDSCEICNPPHVCDYATFSHYQTEHPHYAVYKCSCGAEKVTTETTTVDSCEICNPPVHTHTPKVVRIEATCTVNGMEYTVCASCGEQIGAPTILPAGHKWGEWYVALEPTNEADGREERACSACGAKEERIIPKLAETVKDDESGIELVIPNGSYDEDIKLEIVEQFDGTSFQILNTALENVSNAVIFDITTKINGEEAQPSKALTVKIPLPAGYDPNYTFVYHIDSETGNVENMNARFENGYLIFEATHFSYYSVVEISAPTLVSIAITSAPSVNRYKYGIANLDTSGLEIIATYSDGSTAILDNSEVEFTGFDTSERGIKTITATYEGCTATFDIEVYFTFGQWLLYIICFGWIWM